MKCLSTCGWQEMPNNLVHMKRHLEACVANGKWSEAPTSPIVVWRDGQFTAVLEADEGERQFDVGIIVHKAAEAPLVVPSPGAEPIDVEPLDEQLLGPNLSSTQNSMAAPVVEETRIVAEFEDPTEDKPVAKKPRRKKVN